MFDATGSHTMSEGYNGMEPEAVLQRRATFKVRKYREHSFLHNCEFVPFTLHTYGLMGTKAVEFAELLATEQLAFGTRAPHYLTLSLTTFRMELSSIWMKYTCNAILYHAKQCRATLYKTAIRRV